MKRLLVLTLLSFVLVSCSNNDVNNKDSITLDRTKKDLFQISEDFSYLEKSSEIADELEEYDVVVVFEPNKEMLETYSGVQDEFDYIKLDKNDKYIEGKIIIENKTKENIRLENIFLQGNDKKDIMLQGNYYNHVSTVTPANKKTELEVKIPFDKKGENEISFFPNTEGEVSTNLLRFAVTDEIIDSENEELSEDTFILKEEDYEKYNLLPSIDVNKDINKIIIDKTPYDVYLDILILDKEGRKMFKKENVFVKSKKEKEVLLPKEVTDEINKTESYLFYFNNRSEDIIYDFIAADKKIKPYPTSHQAVIELEN